jgi:hypothetical protein
MERKDNDAITLEIGKKDDVEVYVLSDHGKTVECLFRRCGNMVSGSIPEIGPVYVT